MPINRIENINVQQNNNLNIRIDRAVDFAKILEGVEKTEVKFSGHALERLRARNINLSDDDINKINMAVRKLKAKGGKESLIICNNIAFLTSIRNNTVITAIDSENIKENVFTNIDSAIIV